MYDNDPARHRPIPATSVVGRRPGAVDLAPRPADHMQTEPLYVIPPTQRSPRHPQPGRRPDHLPSQRHDEPENAGRHRRNPRQLTDTELARIVAGLASLAAGTIHVGATPGHWSEWQAAGLFFAGTAAGQILWAVLIVAMGGRFLAAVGILGSLGVVGTWAVSRQWGVPFGPHAGVPEAVGLADTLATLLAGVVTAVALWSLLPRERHGVLSPAGFRLAVIGALLVMATAAVSGTVNAMGPGHSHGAEGGDGHHDDDSVTGPGTGDAEPDGREKEESVPSPETDEPGPSHDDGHDHTH